MQDEKTRRLIFTKPTKEEEQLIRQGLTTYISNESVTHLFEEKQLIIGKGRRQEVYLVSAELWTLYQQLCLQRHPYFIGLFLGELTNRNMRPSLHVLQYLAKAVQVTAKLMINFKGEQRFLYGQSLESEHLVNLSVTSEKEKEVLIINEKQEGLGYGRVMRPKEKPVVVKNQQDLGWYLRQGR